MINNELIRGTLDYEWETGSEGGYWSIVDKDSLLIAPISHGVFAGTKVFAKDNIERRGRVLSAMNPDGSEFVIAHAGDVVQAFIEWEDGEQELMMSSDLTQQSISFDGIWEVKDGDYLTVYEKIMPARVAWEGLVKFLRKDPDTYEELDPPYVQESADPTIWRHWFLYAYPATLMRPTGFIRPKSIPPITGLRRQKPKE
ncbi:hypothetical protein H0V99_00620 [Candidatus Saccharibacteria bacterium]|nr:hypothetical protein [Candidatus Saccharibacteria bacterium]